MGLAVNRATFMRKARIATSNLASLGLIATLISAITVLSPLPMASATTVSQYAFDFNTGASNTLMKTADGTRVIPASTDFTVETWVYVDTDTNAWQTILVQDQAAALANAGRFYLGFYGGGTLHIGVGSQAVNTTVVMPLQTWTHVAVTMDRTGTSTRSITYINGSAVYTYDFTSIDFTAAQGFAVGLATDGGYELDGKMDQVKIWNGALSASDISKSKTAYAAGGISSGTLAAHYDFNEGSGSTINDRSGNGLNLSLTIGSSAFTGTPNIPQTTSAVPTTVAGTAGNAQVALTWAAPTFNGGASITGYTVTSSPSVNAPAGCTNTANLSCTYSGLANGTAYTFTVVAINSKGNSAASAASSSVTPVTTPGAPTSLSGTVGNSQVTLSWTAPTSTGGSAITDYLVQYSTDGSNFTTFADGVSTTTSATVTGLVNGTAYTFKVSAVNAVGTGTGATVSPTPFSTCSPSSSASGGFTTVTFTSTTTCVWTAPTGVTSIRTLLVGGGGGGGTHVAGGGGGGGVVDATSTSVTPGNSYTISVGAGGSAAVRNSTTSTVSTVGGDTTAFGITAYGGGGGGSWHGEATSRATGGGAATSSTPIAPLNTIDPAQGYAGGSAPRADAFGKDWGALGYPTGGGGGAGGAGGNGGSTSGTASFSGAGGVGKISNITGSDVYYGGGGGGACGGYPGITCTVGAGGQGGGAAGKVSAGVASGVTVTGNSGTANTGGGGGATGGDWSQNPLVAGAGGSGVVIVRYVNAPNISLSTSTINATVGSAVTSYSITNSGGAAASYSISPSLSSNGTLSFSTSSGVLSGTPSAVASSTTYTITATNSSGTSTATFTFAAQHPSCSPASSSSGGFTTLTFTSSTICGWTVPSGVSTATVLVVGGGGGGGADGGGGGGGGGVYENTNFSLTSGSSYAVSVGQGGSGGNGYKDGSGLCTSSFASWSSTSVGCDGAAGGKTTFGSITASGGGGGGGIESGGSADSDSSSTSRGGGGGAGAQNDKTGTGQAGVGGFTGGSVLNGGGNAAGGGAGAGANGADGNGSAAGAGGAGVTATLNSIVYGSGGGGGSYNNSSAAAGGTNAANGGSQVAAPTTPVANRGGGGGGGGNGFNQTNAIGSSGAAGVVIVRYANPARTVTYALNSGTGTAPTQSSVSEGATFTVANGTGLSRSGFVFGGWNDGTSNFLAGATYTAGSSNITLTAIWTAQETYTITFAAGTNGTGSNRTSTKTNGTALTLPDSSTANSYFTRTGYAVTGWSTTNGGSQTHALGGSFTTESATTLYPVWSPVSVTITTPASGLSAIVGTSFSLSLSKSGGSGSGSYSISTGSLPAGLSLNISTGVISGTPTVGGTFTIAARFTDSNSATATTSTFNIVVSTLKLDTPSSLAASTISGATSAITVTFNAVSNASSYTVQLFNAGGTQIGSNYTNFISGSKISGLTAGTAYSVKVLAVGDGTSYSNSDISSAATVTTPAAYSLSFAGTTSQYASSTQNVIPSTGSFTVETWISPTTYSSIEPVIFSQGTSTGRIYVKLGSNGRIIVYRNAGVEITCSSSAIPLNVWTHIAIVNDSNTLKCYVNGTLQTGNSPSSTLGTANLNAGFYIGAYSAGFNLTQHLFRGQIDELKVWNVARTQAQIQNNAEVAPDLSDSTLVAYYPLDASSGTTGIELKSGSSNLTLATSMSWTALIRTIAYNAGSNGTGTTSSQTGVSDHTTSITLKNASDASGLSRTGYTLSAWNTNADGSSGTSYALGASYLGATDLTLYPTWTANVVAPTIGTQPTAAAKTVGQSVTFTVVATASDGGNLSYQWQKDGADISGATSASYTFVTSNTSDAGNYQVIVTNTKNTFTATTTSTAVALTMSGALSITTPTSGLSGSVGSTFTTLNIASSGGSGTNTFAVASGTLPAGLSLSSGGAITGTPTTAGTQAITVRVTDSNSATATTTSFTLSIVSNVATLSALVLSSGTLSPTFASGTITYTASVSNSVATGFTVTPTTTQANATTVQYLGSSGTTAFTGALSVGANVIRTVVTAQDGTTTSTYTVTVNRAVQVFAITYAAGTGGSGTGPTSPTTVNDGATFTTPANTFVRTGYTFAGWQNDTSTVGANVTFPTSGTVTGNVTLTATWTPINCTIATTSASGYTIQRVTGSNSCVWTTPTGISAIEVAVVGGGGGGGFGNNGGGGGAGEVLVSGTATLSGTTVSGTSTISATPGAETVVTIGVGGTSGAPTGSTDSNATTAWGCCSGTSAAGGNGGATSFGSISAAGGGGGGGSTRTAGASGGSGGGAASGGAAGAAGSSSATTGWTSFRNDGSIGGAGSGGGAGSAGINAQGGSGITVFGVRIAGGGGGWGKLGSANSLTDTVLGGNGRLASGTWGYAGTGPNYTSPGTAGTGTGGGGGAPGGSGSVIIRYAAVVDYTYNANGGTGTAPAGGSVQGGTAFTTAVNPFTRTGYTFAGWYTTANGTGGTAYTENASNSMQISSTAIVLYAKWTASALVITFDEQGGSSISDGSVNIGASIATTPTAPTRAGYTLSGWSTTSTGSVVSFPYNHGQTADFTLYAIWNANTLTVTYNSQGGSSVTAGSVATDAKILAAPTAPTKTGYTFSGWSATTTGSVVSFTGGYTHGQTANFTLYAIWAANALTITYDSKGGSSVTSDTVNVGASIASAPTAPTKTGYTLAGWSATDGGAVVTFPYTHNQTSDFTLYAKWSLNSYTVVFNANNGSGTMANQTATHGVAVNLSANLYSRANYVFHRWATAADGTGTTYDNLAQATFTAGTTLYAQWTANTYVVTYSYNNATGGNSTSSASFTTAGSPIVLPTPTKTGYTFAGWYSDSALVNSIGSAGANYSPTGATLALNAYAKWTAIDYTFTYDANSADSGSVPTESSKQITQTATVSANTGLLVRAGYTFSGWNTQSNGGGTTYLSGSIFTVQSSNVRLYAKWTTNTYTVTYNSNGGTGNAQRTVSSVATNISTDSYTTGGASIALPGVGTLERAGYTFGGWNTSASGTGTNRLEAATYTTVSDVTLYAKWNAVTYTITYDANTGIGTAPTTGGYTTGQASPYSVLNNTFTKTSNVFGGWNTASNGTETSYSPGVTITTLANIVLYATWIPQYTLHYAINGGTVTSGSLPGDQLYNTGTSVGPVFSSVSRTGYNFGGWSNGSTTVASGGSFIIAADSVLTAIWNPINYVISYESDGGSTAPSSITKQIGQSYTVGAAVSKPGYNFAGWSNGSSVVGAGAGIVMGSSDVTYTAQWVAKIYTISYDWNGGRGTAVADVNYTFGTSAITLPLVGDRVKDGYTFAGWSESTNGSLLSASYIPSQSRTLYALWNLGNFTVTYDPGRGTVENSTVAVQNGASTVLPLPTRANFTFNGWHTAVTGGSSVGSNGASFTPSASQTIYARWIQNSLYGITDSLTRIGSVVTVSNVANTFSGANSNSSVAVSVPANALPAGTTINFDLVSNSSRATGILSGVSYLVSIALSWLTGDETVPDTASDKPITVTISNSSIKTGAAAYAIVNNVSTLLGTATQDGVITVSITSDPEIVVVATKPTAPTNVAATSNGNQQSVISWSAPSSDGGSAITGYTVTANTGASCTISTTSCTISSLSNGTAYTFTVTATNTVGTSVASSAASATTAALYAVTFDSKGGTSVSNGSFLTASTVSEPTAPTRTGYSFAGWAATDGGSAEVFPYAPGVTTNITMYARWDALDNVVTFDSKSGSAVADGVFSSGGTVTEPTAPTRSGYTFVGWSATDGGNVVTFPHAPGVVTDITLYAKWNVVTQNNSGGNGGGNSGNNNSGGNGNSSSQAGSTAPGRGNVTTVAPVTVVGKKETKVSTVEVALPTVGNEEKPATVKIAKADEKVVSEVKIVEGKLALTPETGFSGKKTVTVTVTENGAERVIQIPLTVLPEPVTKPMVTPTSANRSTIRWTQSPNADTYTVYLDGKKVCTTSGASCTVTRVLGPDSEIKIVSNGGDRTVSTRVEADFRQTAPVQITRLVSATITKSTLSRVDTKALDKVIALIKSQGFGTVVISEITTTKKTEAKADARVAAIQKYIESKLGSEKVEFEVVPPASRTYFNNIALKG